MQILDNECEGVPIDKTRIHDIAYNIECGIMIFKSKLKMAKGDLNNALLRYVGGKEDYAASVLKHMGNFILYSNSKNQA